MAVALGTMVIQGKSGRKYVTSIYCNDTTNNLVRFDESKIAVAGSPDLYYVKEQCALTDICLTSDIATPTHLQIMRNGTPTGDILDATANLASVVARPSPVIPFSLGDKISIMQIA